MRNILLVVLVVMLFSIEMGSALKQVQIIMDYDNINFNISYNIDEEICNSILIDIINNTITFDCSYHQTVITLPHIIRESKFMANPKFKTIVGDLDTELPRTISGNVSYVTQKEAVFERHGVISV